MGLPYSLFNPDQSQAQPQTQGQPPQSIIDFLISQSQNQGNSPASPQQSPQPPQQPQQAQPQQPQPDQSQQQPPANNAQNAGPVKSGLRAVLGGLLGNFSYGAGQAMVKASGGETDADKAMRLATMAHVNAQTALTNAQSQLMQTSVPFTLPNGTTVHLPAKMASDLMKQQLANQGKVDAAGTSKRYMAVPNVGLVDTQHPSGTPQVVQGSTPTSVTVTPDMVQSNGIPAQLVGKTIPLSQFAQMERGGAAWAGSVSNTTETKELGDGTLVQIPKTTSTKKVGAPAPGAVTPQPPGTPAAPTLQTRGGVKVLVGADGQPLQGKGAVEPVYATDPKTGQQIFTDRATAQAQGLQTPVKVNVTQVRKDQALSNRLADVQRKVGDYADTFSQPIDSQDQQAIAYLMQNPMPESVAHMGAIPLAGYANNLLTSRGMQALSANGMKRLIQYNQARESLAGYQQILTGSSKGSDTIFHLQEEQLPPPLADKDFANTATGEFQKNIDLAGQHMPIFPGSSETQQSIKAQQLANRAQAQQIQNNQNNPQAYINQHNPGAQNEPPRPSTVPGNYVFNPNGPKGAGWYRP